MTKKQVVLRALLWMGLNSLFILGCYVMFPVDTAHSLCIIAQISSAIAGMWVAFKWPLKD